MNLKYSRQHVVCFACNGKKMFLLLATLLFFVAMNIQHLVWAKNDRYTTSIRALALPTSPLPNELKEITLLFHRQLGIQFLPYLIAKEEGYFTAEGLPPVRFLWLKATESGITKLKQGEVQFSTISQSRNYYYACQGIELVSVAQMIQKSSLGLLVRTDLHSNIKTLKDLDGYRIGIFVRNEENPMVAIKLSQILVEPVYFIDDGLGLLRRGVVDGLFGHAYSDWMIQKYSRHRDVTIFIPLSDTQLDLPEDCLVCSRQFLYKYPEETERFVHAVLNGVKKMTQDHSLALKVMKKYYDAEGLVFDEFIVLKQLEAFEKYVNFKPAFEDNGLLSEDQFNRMKEALLSAKKITEQQIIPYDQYFYSVLLSETHERIKAERARQPKEKKNLSGSSQPVTQTDDDHKLKSDKTEEKVK